MATWHLIIKGKVQGVFYRASTKEKAIETGITGWVKNTSEGHVEMIAKGSDEQLEQFLEWCKTGPSNAQVEHIIKEMMDDQHFVEFTILR